MRSSVATSYKLIERPIYGSSRVGIDNTQLELIGYTAPTSGITTNVLGLKQYELTNHLGNVLSTVSDKKIPVDVGNNGTIDYYVADITSATDSAECYFEAYQNKVQNLHWLMPISKSLEFDKNELLRIHNRYYYPFGSPMDGRTFSSEKYRFGFNGKENDNEVKGDGNSVDFGARIYDSRLGRWLSLDPLMAKNPDISPYTYVFDNPLSFIDSDGKDGIAAIVNNPSGNGGTVYIVATYYVVEGGVDNNGFTQDQINSLKTLESDLNGQNKTVTKDIQYDGQNLNGYNVQFVFNIVSVKSVDEANKKVAENQISINFPRTKDGEEGIVNAGPNNTISNYFSEEFATLNGVKETAHREWTTPKKISAITSSDNKRIANQENGNSLRKNFIARILHEMFHTLGVDKDGLYKGISTGTNTKLENSDVNDAVESLINQGKAYKANEKPEKTK